MIDYFQVQRSAAKYGVSEEIIEKDYLIEIILCYLGKDEYFKEKVVFRGGTALKKVYFPDYRFSEDLDFLIGDIENLEETKEKLINILARISSDFPFKLNNRSQLNKDRFQIFISYDVIPEIRMVKELKVDILKDSFIPTFQKKKILFAYDDFKKENIMLNTYTLESVVSDKIARILDVDKEARDIYDLWNLLKLNLSAVKIKKELNDRFGYEVYLPNLLAKIRSETYRRTWKIRLEKQIRNLLSYETVVKELEELIKNKLIEVRQDVI